MNQNNSHLIAGFFRYHREKLNYSLRGLVGDGKVVDLSSLSAFEHGKKILKYEQLTILFKMIGFDYDNVVCSYDYEKEYKQIIDLICLGETSKAKQILLRCQNEGVFNTLGTAYFSLIKYVTYIINNHNIEYDDICLNMYNLFSSDQKSLIKVAQAFSKINEGLFVDALALLKEAQKMATNRKILAMIMQEYGILYILIGNYAEATSSLLDSKRRYSEFLGIIRMIQLDLNLGNVYSLTYSYVKAEESYLEAYERCLLLNDSTFLLTKCFNNLCWLYFKTNQYDKVNHLLINKPDELVESRNTNFVLAWSYYKLDNKDEAIRLCQEGMKKYSKYTYVCMVYEYIEKACKGIKTGQDALLRKIIETEDYDNTAEIKELFTYEIIDIYERRKNYEKAFKYAKKLLNR